jgi:ATP-binding cassette subfamily F protein uup
VDHLFVFRGEGKIEDFPGNYTDFRAYEDTPSFTNETPDKKPKPIGKIRKRINRLTKPNAH